MNDAPFWLWAHSAARRDRMVAVERRYRSRLRYNIALDDAIRRAIPRLQERRFGEIYAAVLDDYGLVSSRTVHRRLTRWTEDGALIRTGPWADYVYSRARERVLVSQKVEHMPRERLPNDRPSITHRFELLPFGTPGAPPRPPIKIYLTAGMYQDGRLGELFIKVDRAIGTIETSDIKVHADDKEEVSFLNGLLDAVATSMSIGLQHGVPIATFVDKYKGRRFDPSGRTTDVEFPTCTSVLDLIARWLEARFSEGAASRSVRPIASLPSSGSGEGS